MKSWTLLISNPTLNWHPTDMTKINSKWLKLMSIWSRKKAPLLTDSCLGHQHWFPHSIALDTAQFNLFQHDLTTSSFQCFLSKYWFLHSIKSKYQCIDNLPWLSFLKNHLDLYTLSVCMIAFYRAYHQLFILYIHLYLSHLLNLNVNTMNWSFISFIHYIISRT